MENHGILNWRSWSIIRRSQVIGALVGAGTTLVANITILLLLQTAGRGPWGPLLVHTLYLTLWPAAKISQMLFAWKWRFIATPDWFGPSLLQLLLAVLANAFLLGLVGTFSGWLKQKPRATSKERLNS